MALGSTQPLTEMSTWKLFAGKERPGPKADNLTAICEPIVYEMWEPRRLTNVLASKTCYRDSYTLTLHNTCSFLLVEYIKLTVSLVKRSTGEYLLQFRSEYSVSLPFKNVMIKI
jgi:hypothetical protein